MLNIWQHTLGVNISYSFVTIAGGSSFPPAVRIPLSSVGYTHKAKGRGKFMEKDFALLFSSLSPIWKQTEGICLQNCCRHSAPRFPNPNIGLQQSLPWEPALRAHWCRTETAQAIWNVGEPCRALWAAPLTYLLSNGVKLMWSKRPCIT